MTEAPAPTALVVRDAWAPGWTARVGGEPHAVLPLGRHRSVALPAGTSRVSLEYRPRGLVAGFVASGLALGVLAWLARPRGGALDKGSAPLLG